LGHPLVDSEIIAHWDAKSSATTETNGKKSADKINKKIILASSLISVSIITF